MNCNDSDPCTTDSCVGGACQNIQNDPCCGVNCDDFDFCTVDCCISGYCAYDRPAQDCSLFLANTTVAVCPGGTRTVPGSVTNQGQCPETFQWTTPLIVYSGEATGWITSVTAVPAPIGLPGGGLTAISVMISVAADAPAQAMAEVTLQLTSQPDGQACGPLPSQECHLTFMVVVGQVDIDVDSNNNGQISDADDPIEEGAAQEPFTPTTAGKYGWPNHDDSDNNGVRDNEGADANHVNGQTDLEDVGEFIVRKIDDSLAADPRLYITADNPALVRLFQGYTANATAFTWQANRADLTTFVPALQQQDQSFGMEGLASGTTVLTLELYDGDVLVCSDRIRVTVITLQVTWHSVDPTTLPIEQNRYYLSDTVGDPPGPPINPETDQRTLGLKYHPDATAEGGNWNENVSVKVQTAPVVSGVMVRLRAFDPDDPSASAPGNPVDSDLVSGALGDNRDKTARLTADRLLTDASGSARTNFRVSHRPGDNHRVAATIKEKTLYPPDPQTPVLNNDNVPPSGVQPPAQDNPNDPNFDQVPIFIGHISPLLTVWRRLWIEVDSMGPVSWGANSASGTIPGLPFFDPSTPGSPHAIVPIQDPPSEFQFTDQHNFGRMDIVGFGTFLTDRTIIDDGVFDDDYFVRIRNAPANIATALGANYELFDDDKGSDPTLTPPFVMQPDYPPVTLPHFLDLGGTVVPYACAYVTAAYAGVGYFDNNTPFDHQVVNNAECKQSANANSDLTSSSTFWVVHVTAAYQGFTVKDRDPDTDASQWGLTIEDPTLVNGSLVYLETIRDQLAPIGANIAILERLTVVHESGHQFRLQHEFGDPAEVPTYIMWSDPAFQTIFPNSLTFSPEHLKKIRLSSYPQD